VFIIHETDRAHLIQRKKDPNYFIVEIKSILDQIRPTKIEKACVPGDGIDIISAIDCLHFIQKFQNRNHLTSSLFIPASGAATRMFKHLTAFQSLDSDSLAEEFIIHFKQFPFFPDIKEAFDKMNLDLDQMIEENQWHDIIHHLIDSIQFTQLPKALIPFHRYGNESRNAFMEQIREGIEYNSNDDGSSIFHFTISPEFENHFVELKNNLLETRPHVKIHFSHQLQQTDTPALKNNREFARDQNGDIIFRPAGHGALLQNLQSISTDVIFIKNIDNIAHEKWSEHVSFYKQVIGGVLIDTMEKTHDLLRRLEQEGKAALPDAIEFLFKKYGYRQSEEITVNQIFNQLYRPIRVCGMVKNEGEPGGGPFWVLDDQGRITKQIVEKNQIDTADTSQSQCLMQSTHFNPVDIACCIKDHNGKTYSLEKYVDRSTCFISDKFQSGQIVKALELPGLWNGSMAGWNSLFIEVPNETFHPVKTINDLLRSGHLG
jgi:hypothetical protein